VVANCVLWRSLAVIVIHVVAEAFPTGRDHKVAPTIRCHPNRAFFAASQGNNAHFTRLG
jgi:hypothetical protein